MTHVKQFQSIPMSKSMRGLCKEEDYAFLGVPKSTTSGCAERRDALEDDWRDKKEERVGDAPVPEDEKIERGDFRACVCVRQVRRRLEREKRERERLRAIEESKQEKERQWRIYIEDLTSRQEKNLQDRLTRIRKFREFQRKVLEEKGMEGRAASRFLARM